MVYKNVKATVMGLSLALFPMTAVEAQSECEKISISKPLEWSFSAAWNLGQEGGLIFVDPVAGTLDRVDGSGNRTDLSDVLNEGIPGLYRFTGITTLARENVYLLKDVPRAPTEDSRFLFLSPSFEYLGESLITGRVDSNSNRMTRIYEWDLMQDERTVVALADMQAASRDKREDFSAIVKFSLEDTTFEVVERVPLNSPVRRLIRMGYPVLAAGQDELAFMSLAAPSEKLWLKFSDQGHKSRTTGSRNRLELQSKIFPPTIRNLREVQEAYGQLAKDGFISAVILWRDRLFLVELEKTEEGFVPYEWVLKEIDRRTGNAKASLVLPATSRHIMVVPGDDTWAFVEKGIVTSFNSQRVEAFWRVPSAAIESIGSSGEPRNRVEACSNSNGW